MTGEIEIGGKLFSKFHFVCFEFQTLYFSQKIKLEPLKYKPKCEKNGKNMWLQYYVYKTVKTILFIVPKVLICS